MSFIKEFEARGYFYQCTNKEALTELLHKSKVTAYIGFDCTAKSLHVGSLMQIMILRLLQKYEHSPIAIVGGATTKIGDPSFKDEARKMLTDEEIEENMIGIKNVLSKFIDFSKKQNSSDQNALLVNNDDWLSDIKYMDFLRDYGRLFSINRMLSFDSVKLRLDREQSLSFLEFNYMILQAYDFVELYKRYNCLLQIGGSDQWGNIINGVDLHRKLGGKEDIYGLTTPLITTSSGQKMGKTVGGAVWLSEELTSVFDYYQFWRNTEDSDVIKFLKMFTDLSLEKISEYESYAGNQLNEIKKILAFEATKICHGEEKALEAHNASIALFENNILDNNSLPTIDINKGEILAAKVNLYSLLVTANLCKTGGEAKRLIAGGGAKINDEQILDPFYNITKDHFHNNILKLSSGKKKHVIVNLA